jgi:hypothetical protein
VRVGQRYSLPSSLNGHVAITQQGVTDVYVVYSSSLCITPILLSPAPDIHSLTELSPS